MGISVQFWQKAILPINSSIEEAIRNLDEVAIKIVLVVNKTGVFEGTLSDGDIRRVLLKGLDLNSSIENLVHRNALIVPPELPKDLVMKLMTTNKIQQIPVVDKNHHVIGLYLWDQINESQKKDNLMVIMAGGMGTRLHPYTERCPKPLIPVAGKPMLEHIIDRAKLDGFNQFIISINYLGHMIEDYFEDGKKFDIKIDYLKEKSPLGTVGALSLMKKLPEKHFIVTNGDVITDIRYDELLDFHIRHDASATMTIRAYEWRHPFGVVQTDGVQIINLEEKPVTHSYINAGVYALSPKALDSLIFNTPCDMPILFERLKKKGDRIVAYPLHEPWLDVGKPDDLKKASDRIE